MAAAMTILPCPRRVDLTGDDPLEQRPHVPVGVALPRSDGQRPVHHRADRELVHEAARVISHRLRLADAPLGYEIFRNKIDDCTKVVLTV